MTVELINSGRHSEAIEILKEIVRDYPGYFKGNANLGELYLEHYNQYDSAYKYLNIAKNQDSTSSFVLYALSFIELKRGNVDHAERYLKKVIYYNPEHGDAYAKLGMIFLHKGNIDEGIKYLEKAINTGGIPPPTINRICQIFDELGFKDKNRSCLRKMSQKK